MEKKKLFRLRTNKVVGGVCGGLGEYLGIDPVIIRIIWAALIFMHGFGLIAYIIAWIIIPEEPLGLKKEALSRDFEEHSKFFIGAALIVIGALFILNNLGLFSWINWAYSWPIIIIVIGVILILQFREKK